MIIKGIDVNIKDKDGETALDKGLYKIKLTKLLLNIFTCSNECWS